MKNTKKMMALLLALVLMMGCVIGGTIAYLMDKTTAVVNTFTTSDVEITLTESASAFDDGDNNDRTNSYKMVPGSDIKKDPKVTVVAGSEDCYLFVKVEKGNDFANFMTYEMAAGWQQLKNNQGEDVDGVFYREAKAGDSFSVLAGDKVTVKNTVTKEQMKDLTALPTLTFTAYAVQKENISSEADAWAVAMNNGQPVAG